jgi:hypothetical protein
MRKTTGAYFAKSMGLLLCTCIIHGCDTAPSTAFQPAVTSRRPDFQDGPFTLYYTSQSAADVVFRGVVYRIGSDAGPQDMPFSYDWEDDGDVDLHFGGSTYEVEHPADALDDALEALAEHRTKSKAHALSVKRVPALKVKLAQPTKGRKR